MTYLKQTSPHALAGDKSNTLVSTHHLSPSTGHTADYLPTLCLESAKRLLLSASGRSILSSSCLVPLWAHLFLLKQPWNSCGFSGTYSAWSWGVYSYMSNATRSSCSLLRYLPLFHPISVFFVYNVIWIFRHPTFSSQYILLYLEKIFWKTEKSSHTYHVHEDKK